jgi:hypothetical protein
MESCRRTAPDWWAQQLGLGTWLYVGQRHPRGRCSNAGRLALVIALHMQELETEVLVFLAVGLPGCL